ncbi:nucleoside triphosphate pyrophosphohydrolase [Numidum massiliense]|uniref:nucleoside triphosphate pyrophosphohydrolase n=1 Tax=Numidum massiliense TaxID=1522315 RepID=UPI0006D588AF|nr:nucleoside triphosphate pyrophosphohydrolase [Numidum massiliense]
MREKGSLTIVGLGSGDESDLTLEVWRTLQQATHIFLRTARHPVVAYLEREGLRFTAFDDAYEQHAQFADVYEEIVARLFAAAEVDEIVYAVPGHPMVAEQTTQMLIARGETAGIPVEVKGGRSFLEAIFTRLNVDPIDGFQLLDALTLTADACNPRLFTVIAQVYDQLTASDVKLTLMERYPDNTAVIVAHNLGIAGQEHIKRVPLYELDHGFPVSSLSVVAVPPVPDDVYIERDFRDLVRIISVLRGPDGCPWDQQQTHESLRKYLLEETAEFLEAVHEGDADKMCDELGDVLLQVVLHAQIAAEAETFAIDDVVASISAKMIRRHPHVFAGESAADVADVRRNWQVIKQAEKEMEALQRGEKRTKTEGRSFAEAAGPGRTPTERESKGMRSIAVSLPRELPTLTRAETLQKRAAETGFDWNDIRPVAEKVREELVECLTASPEEVELEVGDLLFAAANLARFLDVDPELALRRANDKFIARYDAMTKLAREEGRTFSELSPSEQERLWQTVKKAEAAH